jgi:hypothetical protein
MIMSPPAGTGIYKAPCLWELIRKLTISVNEPWTLQNQHYDRLNVVLIPFWKP